LSPPHRRSVGRGKERVTIGPSWWVRKTLFDPPLSGRKRVSVPLIKGRQGVSCSVSPFPLLASLALNRMVRDRVYHPKFRSIFLDLRTSASYNTGCQKRLYTQEPRLSIPDRSTEFRRRDGSLLTAVKPKLLHQLGDALRSHDNSRRQQPGGRLVEEIIRCVAILGISHSKQMVN
jgi:hypothetical protein